jgi:hypothetical protein
MNASPQHPNSAHSDHSFLHRPLVIAIGVALVWVILVVASDQMWQHAFGYPTWDAVASLPTWRCSPASCSASSGCSATNI